MLGTVKHCIATMTNKDFSDFYQDYVLCMQDRVMFRTLSIDSARFTSLDDVNVVMSELNKMTEELKHI